MLSKVTLLKFLRSCCQLGCRRCESLTRCARNHDNPRKGRSVLWQNVPCVHQHGSWQLFALEQCWSYNLNSANVIPVKGQPISCPNELRTSILEKLAAALPLLREACLCKQTKIASKHLWNLSLGFSQKRSIYLCPRSLSKLLGLV